MVVASGGSFRRRWKQAELANVPVGDRLDLLDDVWPGRGPEEMRVTPLWSEVLLDRDSRPDGRHADHLAMLGLEDREDARFLRQAREPDRLAGCAAPAQRTGNQDVDVAGSMKGHGTLHLRLQVSQVCDGCGCDVGDLVRHRNQRQALFLPQTRCPPPARPPRWWRCGPRAVWRPIAARRYSCTPRCRSR